MAETESSNFVCINCGNSIEKLFKQYGSSVLKLCDCKYCGNVADKYLEYDKIIIVIDLVLLNKGAYRHILYNSEYKSYIKLAFLLLMVISFDKWFYRNSEKKFHEADFYELGFYLVYLSTLMGKLTYLGTVLLCLDTYYYRCFKQKLPYSKITKISKAIICSSFGYFLLLTILIWDDFQRGIHVLFINVYIFLSQIQALTVTTSVPKPFLGVTCALANAAEELLSACLKNCLGV